MKGSGRHGSIASVGVDGAAKRGSSASRISLAPERPGYNKRMSLSVYGARAQAQQQQQQNRDGMNHHRDSSRGSVTAKAKRMSVAEVRQVPQMKPT